MRAHTNETTPTERGGETTTIMMRGLEGRRSDHSREVELRGLMLQQRSSARYIVAPLGEVETMRIICMIIILHFIHSLHTVSRALLAVAHRAQNASSSADAASPSAAHTYTSSPLARRRPTTQKDRPHGYERRRPASCTCLSDGQQRTRQRAPMRMTTCASAADTSMRVSSVQHAARQRLASTLHICSATLLT
jgi:hypothetical protein